MTIECLAGYLAAIVLHEAAHCLATVARGLKVRSVGICARGLYVRREAGTVIDTAWIAAAGPAMNLVLALAWPWYPEFALASLVVGLVNLAPLPHSDGTRPYAAVRGIWRGRLRAPCAAR